jgi:hypothetical protein
MDQTEGTAALRYYRQCEGRWSCVLEFSIVDYRKFFRTPMPWVERMQALSMALLPKLFGKFALDTSVAVLSDRHVVHTTVVRKRDVAILKGTEHLSLNSDGEIVITCEHRSAPFWRTFAFGGVARTAADGQSTTYSFTPWFGSTLQQRGVIVEDGVDLHQKTAWFSAVQRLRADTRGLMKAAARL